MLNISGNSLTDLGTGKCRSSLNINITEIDFSFNKVNNPGILSCLIKFQRIRKLDVSNNLLRQFTFDWQFINTSVEYIYVYCKYYISTLI